jgi:hypothetical protein
MLLNEVGCRVQLDLAPEKELERLERLLLTYSELK